MLRALLPTKQSTFVIARFQERRLQAPGLAKVEKAVEERQVRIDSLQGRINEVQDRIFGAFGRKVGIDNIREYILGQGTVKEKAAAQRMPLAKQVPAASAPHPLHPPLLPLLPSTFRLYKVQSLYIFQSYVR